MTASRAQESTTIAAHSIGAVVYQVLTVGSLLNLYFVDVRNFGAKGDGVTDDTTAIQNAINNANTAGGGTIFFPPGTYIASALTFYGKIRYVGSGIENTILKLKNAANTFLFQSNNFATLTGGNTTGGESNFTFEQMTIDGNKTNNGSSTVPVMRIYGYGYVLRDVRIRNGNNEGFYSEWATSVTPLSPDSMEAHLIGFKVHDNGRTGIHWKGPHDSVWDNGEVFSNNSSSQTGTSGAGIFIDGSTAGLASGTLATNIHSYGSAQTYAWYLGDTGTILSNCVAEGATTAQIGVDANDCTIDGCFVYAAGAATPVGINVGVTASRSGTLITGTKINNCTSGAIAFSNDGGSIIFADGFQSSGSATTGTVNATSLVNYRSDGVSGSIYQIPNNLSIKSGNGLRLYNNSNGSFATLSFDGAIVQDTWGFQTGSGLPIIAGGDIRRSVTSIAFAATITPNASTTEVVLVGTLTANITVNAPTSPNTGDFLTFLFTQDGTGGRTVTWNTVFKTAWQPNGAASAISSVTFFYDGTNWQQYVPVAIDQSGNVLVVGNINMSTAASRLVPGATSFSIRSSDNANDNVLVTNAGAVTVRNNLTVNGVTASLPVVSFQNHIVASGSVPSAAAGANAGGTPPSPVVNAASIDSRGSITFGTGTTPAAGAMVVITFAFAFGAAPTGVVVTANNTATQALGLYVTSIGTGGFTLSCTTAPSASQANTTYSFNYVVIG